MANDTKARYWVGVLYTENMLPDWQDTIGDVLQLPFAYCIHNKDHVIESEEHRPDHVHIIIAMPNTTTYKHAFSIYEELSAPGRIAVNKIERVKNIRHMYDYIIHNTETCRKQGKHLYDVSERILGNNFDIGSYEQISQEEKAHMRNELSRYILSEEFTNFTDFYCAVISNFDEVYEDIIGSYSGLLNV